MSEIVTNQNNMIFRIPIDRINWTTSAFLMGTLRFNAHGGSTLSVVFRVRLVLFRDRRSFRNCDRVQYYAWLSPVVYARDFSRTIAGAFVHAHLRRGGL